MLLTEHLQGREALCNALAAAGYRQRILLIHKEGFSWV
jgi:hypothetical protein